VETVAKHLTQGKPKVTDSGSKPIFWKKIRPRKSKVCKWKYL